MSDVDFILGIYSGGKIVSDEGNECNGTEGTIDYRIIRTNNPNDNILVLNGPTPCRAPVGVLRFGGFENSEQSVAFVAVWVFGLHGGFHFEVDELADGVHHVVR